MLFWLLKATQLVLYDCLPTPPTAFHSSTLHISQQLD